MTGGQNLVFGQDGAMENRDHYQVIQSGRSMVKAWIRGVSVDDAALRQLMNIANMPFIHRWVAAMPDCHVGKGATVGSVVPTRKAIIPAAVGVDIGCGMMAVETTLFGRSICQTISKVFGRPLRRQCPMVARVVCLPTM